MENRKGSRDHQVPSSLALLPFAEVLTEEGTGGLLALVPSSVATSGHGGGSGRRPLLRRRGDSIQHCFDAVTHVIVGGEDNSVAFQLTIARGSKWLQGERTGPFADSATGGPIASEPQRLGKCRTSRANEEGGIQ